MLMVIVLKGTFVITIGPNVYQMTSANRQSHHGVPAIHIKTVADVNIATQYAGFVCRCISEYQQPPQMRQTLFRDTISKTCQLPL